MRWLKLPVNANVLRDDGFGQTEFRVAGGIQEILLTAHATNHDVRSGYVGTAALIDCESWLRTHCSGRLVEASGGRGWPARPASWRPR